MTGVSLLLAHYTDIRLATIGTKFPELAAGVSLPKMGMPSFDINVIRHLFLPAFTIAIICAIESLTAAKMADGTTGKKHNPNTELIAQGMANVSLSFFGGVPTSGAIARTMTNVNNGGKSPVAGLIHAALLLLVFLILMPYVIYIPLSALAGILAVVAYKMSEWRTFLYLLKGSKSDAIILLSAFVLTVAINLTAGIVIGFALSIIFFLKQISDTSSVKAVDSEGQIPSSVKMYEIDGPFFFGLANKLDDIANEPHENIKARIIKMKEVPFIDSTGISHLKSFCARSKADKIQVILSDVNGRVHTSLERSGFAKELGREFICPNISAAVARAGK
jgi:SulP family sulfate permease